MAHFLQQLLKAKEPLFSHGLKNLERATGYMAVDVRLIGDIHTRSFAVMRKLGLDPKDTTRDELWAALKGRIPQDTLVKADYSAIIVSGSLISFNALDVKANRKHEFAERTYEAMQQALIKELIKRYKKTGRVTADQVREWLMDAGVKIIEADDE